MDPKTDGLFVAHCHVLSLQRPHATCCRLPHLHPATTHRILRHADPHDANTTGAFLGNPPGPNSHPHAVFLTAHQIAPAVLGSIHSSVHSAHRSSATIFKSLSIISFLLHARQTATALLDNSPPPTYRKYSYIWNSHPETQHSTLYLARVAFSRVLGALSDNPAISAVAWDVLLSALSLCLWAVVRGLDVGDMLSATVPFKTAQEEEKHVSFEGEKPKPNGPVETVASPTSKRGRGRPRKDAATLAAPTASTSSARELRRSIRHPRPTPSSSATSALHGIEDSEDDDSGPYVPPADVAAEVEGLEPEDEGAETVVEEAEAAALGWGLFALGGLGVLSAGVCGGGVSGR